VQYFLFLTLRLRTRIYYVMLGLVWLLAWSELVHCPPQLAITGTPPRNKKKEGKKPTEPSSSPSSKSTPKITSFFTKTTAA